jgi:DNA-binding SARP family transcriptional activator/tetratricopeptide (TPR) repeat protein
MMPIVDVRLLGAVAAHGSAGRVELGPRRQRFVFAVLALEANHPVSVDRLIELAWSTDPPRTAEHAIEVCVSRLRSAISPADALLVREGRAYALSADPEVVDVHRFQRLLRQATSAADDTDRVAVLTEALDLWSGPPLADAAPADVVDRLCRGLADARMLAVEDRIDARLRLGQHGQAVGELADLTAAYPGRERLIGQYVTALYRCGRAAEALAVCRDHRAFLADELGLDPGVSLQGLEVAILRNDPSLAAPVPAVTVNRPAPRELPGDLACFAGRREELDRLRSAQVPVVALSGTAGVGKTTLAVRFAHQVADRYPDGQLYVNLRGFGGTARVSASVALRQLLTALGVPAGQGPAGVDERSRLYRSLLAGRRILVVLDNARDADHVAPLLPGSAASMAIVTSRTNLAGLVATVGACHIALGVLTADEAREFLAARIGPETVQTQPDPVDEVIARCARLPLALAIASARMSAGPARLAAELADTGSLDALHLPETTVATVLSWSYRVLSEAAARLFRLFGCHPGPDLTEPAAASLAGLDRVATRRCLRELVDANLLAEVSPGRYAGHDLLRAYAADRARFVDPEGARLAALERLVEHYVHTGHTADRLVYPGRPPINVPVPPPGVVVPALADAAAGWAWLTADHDNLLAVLDLAAQRGWRVAAWRLAWALSTLHQRRGHPQDFYRCWRTAFAAVNASGDDLVPLQIYALRAIAEACARMDQFAEAFDWLHEAAGLADRPEWMDERATVLRTLARTYGRSGDDRAAFEHASQSLAILGQLGRDDLVASAANAVGWYAARIGEHDTAAANLRLALTAARTQGDRLLESDTLHSQGYLAQRMQRHEEAIALLRQCLRLARANGDAYKEATSLRDIGNSYAALGRRVRAVRHWRRALPLLEAQARWSEVEELRSAHGIVPIHT